MSQDRNTDDSVGFDETYVDEVLEKWAEEERQFFPGQKTFLAVRTLTCLSLQRFVEIGKSGKQPSSAEAAHPQKGCAYCEGALTTAKQLPKSLGWRVKNWFIQMVRRFQS